MFQPIISREPVPVVIHQDYNTPDIDNSDVPDECRMYRYSLDSRPTRFDDEDDHVEYESLLHRLFVQGVKATRVA